MKDNNLVLFFIQFAAMCFFAAAVGCWLMPCNVIAVAVAAAFAC